MARENQDAVAGPELRLDTRILLGRNSDVNQRHEIVVSEFGGSSRHTPCAVTEAVIGRPYENIEQGARARLSVARQRHAERACYKLA
jgi:hypothetical protein